MIALHPCAVGRKLPLTLLLAAVAFASGIALLQSEPYSMTQEELEAYCESPGYDRSSCDSLSPCCQYDDGQCWAASPEA